MATDLAQVLREADGAELRSVGVADDRARDDHREAHPVLGDEDGLAVLSLTELAHHLASLIEVGIEPRHVLPEHLLRRVPERAPCTVIVEADDALAIDRDDDVGGALEQLLEVDGGQARSG